MNEPPWFCCLQDQTTKFILTNFLLPRSSLTEDKEWRMKKSGISCSQKTFERNISSLLPHTKAFRNSICILCWQLKSTSIEISDPHKSRTAARIRAFAKPLPPLREPLKGVKLEERKQKGSGLGKMRESAACSKTSLLKFPPSRRY